MKLGFLTGNVADIEKAARFGFTGIELSTDAFRDAGADRFDTGKVSLARELSQRYNVEITALAFYALSRIKAVEIADMYARVFDLAETLGIQVVSSMAGFDADRDWNGNIQLFAHRFGAVAELAEQRNLRVAFENWMGFGGHVPFRPVNLGGSPDTWDAMFAAVPSRALGLEFDPSHLYWQGIDHIRALFEFKDRVYHVHAKDTQMLPERRYRGGVNGDYFRFRIPGYGEINWPQFISVLNEIGYEGGVAIEHEDPVYVDARFDEGLVRGWQVLNPLVHPQSRSMISQIS